MIRWLVLSMLALIAAAPARGQDEMTLGFYASVENNIRSEYDQVLRYFLYGRGGSAARTEKDQTIMKVVYYNKAVMFAVCAADAERYRSPHAQRVPAQLNLALTTCVEQRFAELNQFSNALNYTGVFFPDRVEPCSEASRLREQEKRFPPYEFLQMDEPKLYDFARYNSCMITGKIDGKAISPAAP